MSRRSRRTRPERPGPSGFLVIDKPPGWTSHDAVDAARRWLGTRRVGHLGTLDPQATGVLPLAVREATKLIPYVPQGPKVYRGTIRLGVETDTHDGDGQVVARHEGGLPDEGRVREVLASFLGESKQTPPMYSAVKRSGVPLYRLARQGQEIEREPRTIRIERFELLAYEPPDLRVEVECSPGTYVRVLAADVGRQLGCGAYLHSLKRLRSGPFELGQAASAEELEAAAASGTIAGRLIRPTAVLALPPIRLGPEEARRVLHGGALAAGGRAHPPGRRLAALDPTGALIAILEVGPDRRLRPLRVLARLAAGG